MDTHTTGTGTGYGNASQPILTSFVSCATNSLYTEPERVVYASLGAVLSLGISGTNLLIFVIFVKDRSVARVPGHIIITGMMLFSDVLIGVLPLPGYLILTLCNGWPLPKFACDLWITMDYISTNVSYLSVTAVAFERFIAVYFVLKHRAWMCRRNQIRLVVALWIFTTVRIVCSFPLWAIVSGYREEEEYGKCDHPLYQNVPVSLLHRSVSLYIPVVLVFFFYGAIILKIVRTSVSGNGSGSGNGNGIGHCKAACDALSEDGCGDTAASASASSAKTNLLSGDSVPALDLSEVLARNPVVRRVMPSHAPRTSALARVRKSFRMVTLVILAFLVSNLPWHIIENLRVTRQLHVQTTDGIYVFTWILTYMNAFPFNPLFYFFMNKQYRLAFSRCRTCTSNRTVARQQLQRQLVQLRAVQVSNSIVSTRDREPHVCSHGHGHSISISRVNANPHARARAKSKADLPLHLPLPVAL